MWSYLQNPNDSTPYFVQPALSGVGYFAIAWLSNQLASRLAAEGQRARQSQLAATIQRQVNELVIESLPDGVLIVDERGWFARPIRLRGSYWGPIKPYSRPFLNSRMTPDGLRC